MSEDVLFVKLDVLMEEYNKKLDTALDKMGTFGKKTEKESKGWAASLEDVIKGYVGILAAEKAVQSVVGALRLEEKYKALLMPLENVTKANGEFGSSLQFIKDLADQTGQDVFVLGGAYKNMYAAATQAGMATSQLNSIYGSIIKAGSSLRLSNDQVSLSLKAIEQMMNKGTISSEELKQQLGDHLPAAFGTMAMAAKDAGISTTGSTAELIKLMEQGKVASNVVLPFFAKRMEEAFGANADANINTIQGSANRLKNEFTYLIDALDRGKVIGFWASFQNGIADTLTLWRRLYEYGSFSDVLSSMFAVNLKAGNVGIKLEKREKRTTDFTELDTSGKIKALKANQAAMSDAITKNRDLLQAGIKPDLEYITQLTAETKRYTEILKSNIAVKKEGSKGAGGNYGIGKEAIKEVEGFAMKMKLSEINTREFNKSMAEHLALLDRLANRTATPSKLQNTGQINAEKMGLFNEIADVVGYDANANTEKWKERINGVIKQVGSTIQDSTLIKDAIAKLAINTSDGLSAIELDSINRFLQKMQESLRDATAFIDTAIGVSVDFLSDTFATGFASIFSTKIDFQKSFKPILAGFLIALGDMVTQMGKKILIAAIAKEAAEKALASFFGGGIPAAIALISIGSALKGGGMSMNANSGISSNSNPRGGGGSPMGPGFTAPSLSVNFKPVIFEMQGSMLKGVLDVANYQFGK